jgi:fatty acid desaturase
MLQLGLPPRSGSWLFAAAGTFRSPANLTRTTLTGFPIRFLMWNMPYHAEHHLCPAVPFHRLPALHRLLREKLAHVAPSFTGRRTGPSSILCNAG